MALRRTTVLAWYALSAVALRPSSPTYRRRGFRESGQYGAEPAVLERVSTLAEARPPFRKIGTVYQRGDDGFAISVDGLEELRFLRAKEAWSASLGAALWPSSLALAGLVRGFVKGKSVLELGSGLGLGGKAAVQAGASRVVCTDVDDELVEMLGTGAKKLDWCDADTYLGENFDVVIGADLAYDLAVVPDLVNAITAHVAADGVALIVGECKRPAIKVLLDALPGARALDYDMERRTILVAPVDLPPESFGIAVVAHAKSQSALDALLDCLEDTAAGASPS